MGGTDYTSDEHLDKVRSSQPELAVWLKGPVDFEGFRLAARGLLARKIGPDDVQWHSTGTEPEIETETETETEPEDLFNNDPINVNRAGDKNSAVATYAPTPEEAPTVNVPPEFMALCQTAILHRDANRFELLYRILWRLVHEPALRHDPLDTDMMQAQALAESVREDMRNMKSLIRFRTLQDDIFKSNPKGGPLHVAWFEPVHHIVEATVPFFERRFTQMRWALITPECSVEWDGGKINFAPGVRQEDAPQEDAGESLWLSHYQRIFKPARLESNKQPVQVAASSATPVPKTRVQVDQPVPLQSLEALREATNLCRECPIGEFATQSVNGEGRLKAKVMFVGEQPGDQEDLRGHPFVGPAGRLFDKALAELGINRDDVFVSNAVKHFKFELRGKRRIHKTPTQREASACLHWLENEIALVQPEMLVALGATAARSLMGKAVPVTAFRGQFLNRSDGRKVLITLHPSALLRAPPETWDTAYKDWLTDLALIAAAMN